MEQKMRHLGDENRVETLSDDPRVVAAVNSASDGIMFVCAAALIWAAATYRVGSPTAIPAPTPAVQTSGK